VVWNPRVPDCPQEYGVVLAQTVEAVLRHHPARLEEVLTPPVEELPIKPEAPDLSSALQNPDGFRNHLFSNTVSGDDGDTMLHDASSTSCKRAFSGLLYARPTHGGLAS
jgi:hypothetical protein